MFGDDPAPRQIMQVLSTAPMMKQENELFRELTFKGGSVSLASPRSCLDNGVHLTSPKMPGFRISLMLDYLHRHLSGS